MTLVVGFVVTVVVVDGVVTVVDTVSSVVSCSDVAVVVAVVF